MSTWCQPAGWQPPLAAPLRQGQGWVLFFLDMAFPNPKPNHQLGGGGCDRRTPTAWATKEKLAFEMSEEAMAKAARLGPGAARLGWNLCAGRGEGEARTAGGKPKPGGG